MPNSKHGYETDSEDNRTRITQLLENYKAGSLSQKSFTNATMQGQKLIYRRPTSLPIF